MSEFSNIRFDPNNGIYFEITIGEVTKNIFLDILLLEDLSNKKIITIEGIALTLFYGFRTTIFRMCIHAFNENPSWPKDVPLPLLKKHNR